MIVERFTFPGELCFELESDDPSAVDFFQAEYGWARGSAKREADLTLRWRQSAFANPSAGETTQTHKVLARWCYKVQLSERTIELRARGNSWALPMVHHMLVHSSLRYLAAQRGLLLLHAAAVEREGRSVILTGGGGVGKTTTSSLLLARGDGRWRYHADDYVILDPNYATSFAYPTRAHLYGDLLTWVPEIDDRLTAAERLKVRLFGGLREASGRRINWPTRIGLQRLWPNRELAEQAGIAGLFLLERGEVDGPRVARYGEVPLEDLLTMNFGEARHFIRLLEKAGVWSECHSCLARWRETERDALRRLTTDVPTYRLILPTEPQRDDLAPELERAVLAAIRTDSNSV